MTKQEIQNLKAGDVILFKSAVTRSATEWFLCKLRATATTKKLKISAEMVWYFSGRYIHTVDDTSINEIKCGIAEKKFFVYEFEFHSVYRSRQRILSWKRDLITKLFTYKTVYWQLYK